ncbi:E3 ubiquitin-protein ligase ubr2 [Phytophthora pseudosyringae]|uniref:E3 ubiquitin-protein ligase n=1 Tax=Phytophthora pseudosyringae TaxID=221518 RepID=A0A8T1VGV2_9STRA|nr:E3 ubiquitin-protein ligase ubr2 [Phytophthora pseudosyringae]
MSKLPLFDEPMTLRRFLQMQSVASICRDTMPSLLAELRHLRALGDTNEPNSVPLEDIGHFLDAILLAHADRVLLQDNSEQSEGQLPPVTRDAFLERFKPKSSTQVLCGYLFQRNDIVFNCKTCQSDETCVLCLKCFQNGNHEGHDVFFHRTSPGGVCDCGDSEAWAPEGFCVHHGQREGDAAATANSGNAGSLPDEIVQVADALFTAIVEFCVEMAKRSMQVFDAESVDAQGRQTLHELRRKVQERGDSVEDAQTMERQFHVRICNDDVHSDEDLIRSLSQKRILKAEDLVRAIDSNGSEIVAQNLTLRDALTLMQALKSEGWHVCVVQDKFIHDEDVLLRVTQWVKAICSLSKQLHVLFCDKLFATNGQSKEPIQVMFLSDPYFRKDIVLELYELYLKLQGDKDPKLQFSIVFLKVYHRMMLKYFCGVGTREESLFQYGVQILTTPSIVHHLASLGLLDMLLDTINTALEMARSPTLPPHHHQGVYHTLDCDHPLLKFKRYHFVIENFGYVLGIPAMSSGLLLRSDLLEKWLDALAEIQGLDPQVRIQDGRAHVTYETQSWLTAFAFHANVSKILTFISKGLRYHEAADTDIRNQDRERMVFNMLEGFWEQLDRAGMTTTRLQLYTPPCGRLMGSPYTEKIVKFDVSTQPVSFHNPLHGLLASFLIESLYYGPPPAPGSAVPWVTNWGALFERSMTKVLQLTEVGGEEPDNFVRHKKTMLIYGMMEFPLRSLVLCAQISCGLWIRNGQNLQRQMLNYTSPPWCSELRDLDIFLVQVSATIVGFPKFLTIFFDRFGLSEWLLTWANARNAKNESSGISARETQSSGSEDEKLVGVLEAALLQLIWIVTELTPPLDAIEQRDTVLRREIIHRLSQHPCRLSELLDQTTFVVSTPFGGISARQEKQHLTRLERILDEVADEQIKRSVMVAPLGDRAGDDDSMGDGAMEPTKYTLKKEYFKEYDPSFYHLSRSSHEKAQFARQEALFKSWKVEDLPVPLVAQVPPPHVSLGTVRFLVLEKGLLGVLRLVLEDANCPTDGHCEGMSCTPGVKRSNVMVVLRAIHLINLVVLVLKRGAGGATLPLQNEVVLSESKRRQTLALLRNGPEAFEESETNSRGKKRVKRQPMSSDDGDVPMSSDSDQGDMSEVKDLSIVALLVALSKDMINHDFETSKSTVSAIYWILNELAALDRVIHAYVELKVWSGMKKHEELVAENGMSKTELKKLHQQRAIAAMMARQKAFAQSSAFAEMDDGDQDDEDSGGSGSSGKFGTDFDDLNHELPGHTIVYRPPPPPDCIICSQKEKDEPIMYIGHAQMTRVNAHALENLPGDVETAVAEGNSTSDSSNTPPSSATGTSAFPPQIHLSLCGHAVHLHCWQKYFESVRAQSRFNLEHSQTNIAFDAHFGEFLCPLCQALSSMLVPCLPICPPLTAADQQRDRDSMERVFQSKQDTSSILSWLSDGLPSRLEEIAPQNEGMSDDEESGDERTRLQRQDDIRAMNQFAVSFLETMLRFQPEMTHLATAMNSLKKGFFSTGPQLTHLIWSSVASTITSTQLSGISSAIFSLETYVASTKNGNKGSSWRSSSAARTNGGTGPATAASSFSSLRITNILNPVVPCLKTRVAVSLPEALDPQLDQFTPKDDSKLNVLLRSLRRMPLLFTNRRRGFYQSMCFPIAQNLRLALSPEQWMETLSQGPPLQLGQPILGHDLFYLSVAICSSMLTTKADILLTIRSLCVLHMAQVLIHLSQMEAEDEDDCLEEEQNEAEGRRAASKADDASPDQMEEMQRGLETLMARLAQEAGVDVVVSTEQGQEEDDSTASSRRRPAPQGRQLQLLFKSSCLAFMRQVTLLCRAFFRGEQDPDASWSANFVSSLRLSTNYHDMCQQLGLPRITQLLADEALVDYLLRAARELRVRPTSAAVSEELQHRYKQHGHADLLVAELQELVSKEQKEGEDVDPEREALIARGNLREMPRLPLRLEPDAQQHKNLFHFANTRLVKLASSYTDLHSEVLGKSKCKQTWKTVENPAICLVCEQVLCAGTECCRRRSDGMGACTHHAITCGAGVGLFFLMRSSSVLLVFGPRSSYFGSPYLDMFGEEDINVRRGRPLYLNAKRVKALQALYANHQLANEVARNRRTSDQYIRNNYY